MKGFKVPAHVVDTTMRAPLAGRQASTKKRIQEEGGKRTSINLRGVDVRAIEECKALAGHKDDTAVIRAAIACYRAQLGDAGDATRA